MSKDSRELETLADNLVAAYNFYLIEYTSTEDEIEDIDELVSYSSEELGELSKDEIKEEKKRLKGCEYFIINPITHSFEKFIGFTSSGIVEEFKKALNDEGVFAGDFIDTLPDISSSNIDDKHSGNDLLKSLKKIKGGFRYV